jgi:chromosome segregation ATPase
MDDQFVRLSELEEEMSKANETLEAEQKASAALKIDHEELSNLANERLAESISAQRAYQKVQEEAEKLEKAVSYLEDRCQAYQNTILDHGLVVRGEETSEWRTGFNDPRFKTLFSKQAQTELTG